VKFGRTSRGEDMTWEMQRGWESNIKMDFKGIIGFSWLSMVFTDGPFLTV